MRRGPHRPVVARGGSGAAWAWFALVSAGAFGVLTLLVATDVTQPLDDRAIAWLRPDDEWTWRQAELGWVIDFFEPRRMLAFLAALTLPVALHRRSWRPLAFAGTTALAGSVVITASKLLLTRPDPHAGVSSTGGSFPSGHVATVVLVLGIVVLLQRGRTRWWHWSAVAAGGVVMAIPLLFGAAHWPTDVAGGVLLAITVLAVASRHPWRRWPAPPRVPRRAVRTGASGGRTVG